MAEPIVQVFLLEHIAQLVAYDFRPTYLSVDVGVWVPVYPAVDAAVGDEVTQLSRKGAVDGGAFVLWCHHLPRRQVMGHNNNLPRRAFRNTLLDEVQAEAVHLVVVRNPQPMAVIHWLCK